MVFTYVLKQINFAILFLIIFLLYHASLNKDVKSIQTSEYVKIGSSDLSIKTPYALTTSTLEFPLEMKLKIVKYETFAFQKDKSFNGKINYMLWKKEVKYSIKNGVDQAIQNINALSGVEKIDEFREYYNKGKYDGCNFDLTIFRYGKPFFAKGTIIKSGQESWMIIMTMLDSKEKIVADKILASIRY